LDTMFNIVATNLHALLTIGDLANEVGVKPATIREWERRHGFPVAQRLPSGHRRYPSSAVADVKAVVERRRKGFSLSSAIAATRGERPGTWPTASVFAAAREASDRPPTQLSRRAMLAFSRSIEDACAAAGGAAVIVGCFQREHVYRARARRWNELARSARVCVVLADFAEHRQSGSLIEVPIAPGSPLHREWAVAVATPQLAACLAGWEWPGGDHFEALWSIDPVVVGAAIDRALAVARATTPERAIPDADLVTLPAHGDVGAAMRLLDRVVARLDR